MPAFILPQILLCGLLVPRDEMAQALDVIAGALPLTYAYDALARVAADQSFEGRLVLDVAVVVGVTVLALALGGGDAAPPHIVRRPGRTPGPTASGAVVIRDSSPQRRQRQP